MAPSTQLVFVTVVSSNYLHFARALANSIGRIHPECRLIACISDCHQTPTTPSTGIHWIPGSDLLADQPFERFAFKYNAIEMTTSLKPRIAQWALDQGYGTVVYIDGDIQLYRRLDEFNRPSSDYGVCLTPHLLKPTPADGLALNEKNVLAAGIYNAGWIAVRNNRRGRQFIRWWTERLTNDCIIDMAGHRFADQRIIDLAPAIFDGVRILRRSGFHTAYWNLGGCKLSHDCRGNLCVDDQPLTLFHYSGFNPHDRTILSRYQNCLKLDQYQELIPLVNRFADELLLCGFDVYSAADYGFSRMTDGTAIKPYWREAIRTNHPALADIENPFDVRSNPGIYRRFLRAKPDVMNARVDWQLCPKGALRSRSRLHSKIRNTWKQATRYLRNAA